jgi:hypothetical protein
VDLRDVERVDHDLRHLILTVRASQREELSCPLSPRTGMCCGPKGSSSS